MSGDCADRAELYGHRTRTRISFNCRCSRTLDGGGRRFGSVRAYYFDFAFHLGRRPILQVWVMAGAATRHLG